MLNKITFYWKGDKAQYTGKSEMVYGGKFFQITLLEGMYTGQERWTSRCPDCGLMEGQDKPANAPCHTCEVEEVKQ
jgi:hypothetical protein